MFEGVKKISQTACLALASLSFTSGCNSQREENEPRVIKADKLLGVLEALNAEREILRGIDMISLISDAKLSNPELADELSAQFPAFLDKLNKQLDDVSPAGRGGILANIRAQEIEAREFASPDQAIEFLNAVKEKLINGKNLNLKLK
jgi:hypothetical protein